MIGGAEMRHGRATYGLLSRGALHSPAPWLGLSLQGGREERRLSSRGAPYKTVTVLRKRDGTPPWEGESRKNEQHCALCCCELCGDQPTRRAVVCAGDDRR